MKKVLLTISAIALAGSMSAAIAGDAAAGKAKSAVCAACHGIDGVAPDGMKAQGYPNLKGQNAIYIVNQLKAFKDGTRSGGMTAIMAPMAMPLSDADMANLGAYYESLQ